MSWRFFQRQPWLCLGFVIVLLGVAARPVAAAEPPQELKKIAFPSGEEERQQKAIHNLRTGIRVVQGSAAVGAGATGGKAERVEFPPLHQGNILPVNGYLYRVTAVCRLTRGNRRPNDFMVIEWLNDQQAPPGITLRPDSITIPLRDAKASEHAQGGKILFGSRVWTLEKITPPARAGESCAARLNLFGPFREGQEENKVATVRPNDVLVYDSRGYLIRNIVPANATTGVIGWVELDPRPLTGAELAKAARTVRPQPE